MDHDSGYHLLFSNPKLVIDLLRQFVPASWVDQLDLSSLQRVNAKFHTDAMERRESDIIYRINLMDGRPLYLYLLLEFQSKPYYWMPVRVGAYVFLLYQHLIREKEITPKTGLPPVFPLVLYNGDTEWRAAKSLDTLIRLPEASPLWPLQPNIGYHLVEERLHLVEMGDSLTGLLFEFGNCAHPAQMRSVVRRMAELVFQPDDTELKGALFQFIKQIVSQKSALRFTAETISELSEVTEMLSTRLDQWEKEFLEKGIEKGKQQGESTLLFHQLTHRFGPLPDWVAEKLATADSNTLETWGLAFLDADTLEAVFK